MINPLSNVAREGWPYLALAVLMAALASLALGLTWVSALAWAAVMVVLRFFRENHRAVPSARGAVLSPADGRIVRIERRRDRFANRDALMVSVITPVFRHHANRASVDGVVQRVDYFPVAGDRPSTPRPGDDTEHNAVVIDANGVTVTLVQVAGLVARRILCHVKPGDVLTRGQRYGGARFGARLDVYLPPDAVLKVTPGDKVLATTTILATLPTA